MKKVSLVAAIATLLPTLASANVPANCPKAFQGFHLGGNVGLGVGAGSQNAVIVTQRTAVPGFNTFDSSRNRLGVKGFDGGLNTGYTHRFGNFGLGLEFVANWTNSKGSLNNLSGIGAGITTDNWSARLNNSLQLRANFSYVIANLVAPKLILGWDSSNWKLNSSLGGFNTFNAAGTARVPFNAERSKYLNAFLIGAGVDFLATKHFILGMDATVSMFNKATLTRTYANSGAAVAGNANIPNTVTSAVSFKPEPYTKISLIAKFIY